MKELLFKSSFFRFLERGVVVITSLLLTPYFIKEIGTSNYGLWLLILSVMGWFDVVDLGFPKAVQRQIIRALELKDTERVNVVFSTSMVLFAALGGLAAILLICLTRVPAIFGVSEADQITLVNILMILSVKVLWGFMMNPFHGIFAGLLRYDVDAKISSITAIGKALLVFWLISDFNIWGAVVATLVSDIVTNLLKIYFAKKLFPGLGFKFNLISLNEIRDLFHYSKHLVVNGMIKSVGEKSRPLMVTHLFDLQSLAIMRIAGNLVMHVRAFVQTVTGVFSPVFNKMVSQKQDMEKIFIHSTIINLFVFTVLNLTLLLFGKTFIILWVGIEFEYAVYILYVSVLASICTGFTTNARNILLAQANHKLLSVVSLCSVSFNIPVSIFLGIKFGLIGITIGGVLSSLLFELVGKMGLFLHYNKYNVVGILKKLLKSILLVYTLGYFGSMTLERLNVDTWFELVLSGIVVMPVIVIICWYLILSKDLRIMLSKLLIERLKSRKFTS